MCVSNATKEHETDTRTAAFVLPVGRVAEAIKSLGLWLWVRRQKKFPVANSDCKPRRYNVALAHKVFKGRPFHFLVLGHATMCNLELIMSAILSISLK